MSTHPHDGANEPSTDHLRRSWPALVLARADPAIAVGRRAISAAAVPFGTYRA